MLFARLVKVRVLLAQGFSAVFPTGRGVRGEGSTSDDRDGAVSGEEGVMVCWCAKQWSPAIYRTMRARGPRTQGLHSDGDSE
jgi:hypothetical protein